ncbi:MAG: hypothetical protein H6733_11955 [Alphaproteobacteria bacterium]|nr:hypothetical protein [Alphaproteobacteria bacterium]
MNLVAVTLLAVMLAGALVVLALFALVHSVGRWLSATPPLLDARDPVPAVPAAPTPADLPALAPGELVRFLPAPPTAAAALARREAPAALVPHLQALTDLATRSGATTAQVGETTTRLVFSPDVQAGLQSGAYKLITDAKGTLAIARDAATGKIVQQGRLVTGLSWATATVAAWQVAAMVTAQHHLVALEARLAALESGLTAVRDWLEDKERSRVLAAGETAMEWLHTLQGGRATPQDVTLAAQRLDRADTDVREVMLLVESQLARVAAAIDAVPAGTTLRVAGMRATGTALAAETERAARLATMWTEAAAVRGTLAALRPTVGLDPVDARGRIARLSQQVERVDRDLLEPIRITAHARRDALGARLARARTLDRVRAEIGTQLDTGRLDATMRRGAAVLDQIGATAERSATVPLVVDVERGADGAITAAWLVAA